MSKPTFKYEATEAFIASVREQPEVKFLWFSYSNYENFICTTMIENIQESDGTFICETQNSVYHIVASELKHLCIDARDYFACREGLSPTEVEERAKIIKSVTTWAGSESKAYAWYCKEPIPAIGNVTAEFAVKSGNIKAVRDYLCTIAMGGHA